MACHAERIASGAPLHETEPNSRDYQRIAKALDYVASHARRQPELGEIAAHVGLSEFHLQRTFTRWVGISPKRFLQHVTLTAAKRSLEASQSVFDAALDAGLSGPGRLHDLFVTYEAVTPGEYKSRGAGLDIAYGFHDSPFGEYLLLSTERGVCGMEFIDPHTHEQVLTDATRRWPAANLTLAPECTNLFHQQIFAAHTTSSAADQPLRLLLCGTRFQLKVWQALLQIPAGHIVTYQQIASHLGYPVRGPAARAIGTAAGENAIPWLIPCHRVLRKDGLLGGYRYGAARKLAMLGWEATGASLPAG
ncbi:MAG: bifunctional helix-turn-helix domain-containing protein/methylated-DNA--[protein]-cysteine S-methyltransferase [Gammaproteobacteria bacterium]|nr:bifunctional helix-turn-helix domain-containing protein/methylated-DNA--[protein]-cysteine S-methyltransferase [Gammaproteobacteria bacterium]